MIALMVLKITEIGGPGIMLKNFRQLKRKTFLVMAGFWHTSLRPKHFTKAGAREYKYTLRKGDPGNIGRHGFNRSYQGRKLNTKGHTRPLTYSGKSEELARVRDVRSTSTGSQVVMRVNALNLKNPHSNIPSLREELAKISDREIPLIVQEGEFELDKEINAFEGQITVTTF